MTLTTTLFLFSPGIFTWRPLFFSPSRQQFSLKNELLPKQWLVFHLSENDYWFAFLPRNGSLFFLARWRLICFYFSRQWISIQCCFRISLKATTIIIFPWQFISRCQKNTKNPCLTRKKKLLPGVGRSLMTNNELTSTAGESETFIAFELKQQLLCPCEIWQVFGDSAISGTRFFYLWQKFSVSPVEIEVGRDGGTVTLVQLS